MKFIFHVFKKSVLFVPVYDSEPMEANECRRQANLKRKEYGKEYDVYYTIKKDEEEFVEESGVDKEVKNYAEGYRNGFVDGIRESERGSLW